jgi:hypothetical protein
MDDLRTIVHHEMARAGSPSYSFNDLGRRRDRKRRNQRIAAATVGIAVFVAAVLIVTTGGAFDRSTPAVPGGSETGSTQTAPPAAPDTGWDGQGLPPEGTALSTPVEGKLIARRCCFRNNVSVYADGRVIWWASDGSVVAPGGRTLERRLTSQSVDLVRSGAITIEALSPPQVVHGIPASAWVDAEARLYAPPRYKVCFSPDPSAVLGRLPAPAEALLRGSGSDPSHGRCLEVTTEEARALDEMLSEAGLSPSPAEWAAAAWFLREDGGDHLGIYLMPLLPDGVALRVAG